MSAFTGAAKKTDKQYKKDNPLSEEDIANIGAFNGALTAKGAKEEDKRDSVKRQKAIEKDVYAPRRKANSVARAGQLAAEKIKAKKAKQAKRSTMEKDMSERGIPKKDVARMKQIN